MGNTVIYLSVLLLCLKVSKEQEPAITTPEPAHTITSSSGDLGPTKLTTASPEQADTKSAQAFLDRVADTLDIRLKIIDNLRCDGKMHKIQVTLTNKGQDDIEGGVFDIYFYSFSMLEPLTLPNANGFTDKDYKFNLKHVTGSLFRLRLTPSFTGLQPNNSRDIQIYAKGWSVAKTDFPPNWYIAAKGLQPRIIKSTAGLTSNFVENFTSAKQWKRFRKDKYNPFTPNDRYDRFITDSRPHPGIHVTPTPVSLQYDSTNNMIHLDQGKVMVIGTHDLGNEVEYLAGKLGVQYSTYHKIDHQHLGFRLSADLKLITLLITPNLGESQEAYVISADWKMAKPEVINIYGSSPSGVFYGIQTLLSVINDGHNMTIPSFRIEDYPRYSHRGLHLDIARNFYGKDDIKRLISVMAMYKLNVLHLQLSDNEGWRIEMENMKHLIKKGSSRCHGKNTSYPCLHPQLGSGPFSNSTGSGYLSINDYKEILAHAGTHHVKVIPGIPMPSHLFAAIKSSKQSAHWFDMSKTPCNLCTQMYEESNLDFCKISSYDFIMNVFDFLRRHAQSHNISHIGGFDDATKSRMWKDKSECIKQTFLKFLTQNNENNENVGEHAIFTFFSYLAKTSPVITTSGSLLQDNGIPFEKDSVLQDITGHFWDNVWENKRFGEAYKLANAGYKIILSPVTHLHFDHPYEPDPEERGRSSSVRYIDTKRVFHFKPDDLYANINRKISGETLSRDEVCSEPNLCPQLSNPENIIGIQGMLWTHTIMSRDQMDYMLFPRVLALAERAWHKAAWENNDKNQILMEDDWETFAFNVGQKELKRLDRLGIMYRISPPGARAYNDSLIQTVTEFPDEIVEYSTDSGKKWKPAPENWSLAVQNNRILLRTIVQEGRVKTNTDFMGQSMEFSVDKGKTWKLVPKTWPIASYNPILLRTRSANAQRTSRAVEFDPRGENPIPDQDDIADIAHSLQVYYKVVDNLIDKTDYFFFKIYFFNIGKKDIVHGNWSIHFYSIRLLEPDHFPYRNGYLLHDCGLWLHHMGGSLYRLEPEYSEFKIPSGKSISCLFRGKYWQVARTDIMPNWYVAAEGMDPKVIENTRGESLSFVQPFRIQNTWKRFPDDQYNPLTPRQRYKRNGEIEDMGKYTIPVIPEPKSWSLKSGFITVEPRTWMVTSNMEFQSEIDMIAKYFKMAITSPEDQRAKVLSVQKKVVPDINDTASDGYEIHIEADKQRIDVIAYTAAGAFYAFQSLVALSSDVTDGWMLPSIDIVDSPRYRYRGLHLDVARNFHPKDEILKLLDLMGRYKLNKFHFHLSDDEGWRLEIPGLPDLTEIGAHRCYGPDEEECLLPQLGSGPTEETSGSGFYTVQEYIEIVEYATKRHIEVIPEFDTPGHSRAAIKAMESRYKLLMRNRYKSKAEKYLLTEIDERAGYVTHQGYQNNVINPCMTSTYAFIHHVIRELKKMHSVIAPLKVYHIGGPGGEDFSTTVWNHSKICKKHLETIMLNITDLPVYFISNIGNIAGVENINLGFWEDSVMKGGAVYDRRILPGSPREMYAYAWKNIWEWGVGDHAHKLANAGYKVIIAHATHLFFDHPYEPDPEERGYYWAARYTDTRKVFGFTPDSILRNAETSVDGVPVQNDELCKKSGCEQLLKPENIEGIQAQIWTETIRTEKQLHEMTFPRLIAFAERAWHKASWEDDPKFRSRNRKRDLAWERFANTIGYRELPELDKRKIKYRIPVPGVRIKNGILKVNVAFPGLDVEYSVDNGKTWRTVKETANVKGIWRIHLRTRSANRLRTSRTITIRPALLFNFQPYWQAPYYSHYIKYLTRT